LATGIWLISYGSRLASFSATLIAQLNLQGWYRFCRLLYHHRMGPWNGLMN